MQSFEAVLFKVDAFFSSAEMIHLIGTKSVPTTHRTPVR